MVSYDKGRFVGRAPLAAGLLQTSQSESLFTITRSKFEESEDVGLGGLLSRDHDHQGATAVGQAPAAEPDVTNLTAAPGGLFFGLEAEAAGADQGTPGAGDQLVDHWTESARAAALEVPTTEELQRKRQRRKDMLPLDADGCVKVMHYRVLSRLGQGGLATVFLAEDVRTRKRVALKISTKPLKVLSEDCPDTHITTPEFARSLFRESWEYRCFCSENETFLKLRCCDRDVSKHGLPQLFDSGLVVIEGIRVHSFLAMSLLGPTVYEEIQEDKLKDRANLCNLAHGMLNSLHWIHSRGLVHRDVKPGNFCLPHHHSSGPATFIIDFGFVKPRPKVGDSTHQDFEGTPDYASINALLSRPQGPCDDLECLAYAILEMWNGELHWDVPNPQRWSLASYRDAVTQLYHPTKATQLLALPTCKRHPLPWNQENLAIMAKLRRKEWEIAVDAGIVPRFLQLWLKHVQRLKPHQMPSSALYARLHELIDHGLMCEAEDGLAPAVWDPLPGSQANTLATTGGSTQQATQDTFKRRATQSQQPVEE